MAIDTIYRLEQNVNIALRTVILAGGTGVPTAYVVTAGSLTAIQAPAIGINAGNFRRASLQMGYTPAIFPSAALISPTVLNGGFETAGGGGADVLADWEEFPSGTSTVNRDTSVFRSGAASCRFDVDASNSYVAIGQGGLILGKRYKIVAFARNQGGAGEFQIDTGSVYVSGPLTTSFAKHEWEFVATTTSFEVKRGSNAASQSIWIDDVTLTPLVSEAFFNHYESDLALEVITDRKAATFQDHDFIVGRLRYLFSWEAGVLISPSVTWFQVLNLEEQGNSREVISDDRFDSTTLRYRMEIGLPVEAYPVS